MGLHSEVFLELELQMDHKQTKTLMHVANYVGVQRANRFANASRRQMGLITIEWAPFYIRLCVSELLVHPLKLTPPRV